MKTKQVCPNCSSDRIHRVDRSWDTEALITTFEIRPICGACRFKWLERYIVSWDSEEEISKASSRSILEAKVYF
jgi:transposase-like protein